MKVDLRLKDFILLLDDYNGYNFEIIADYNSLNNRYKYKGKELLSILNILDKTFMVDGGVKVLEFGFADDSYGYSGDVTIYVLVGEIGANRIKFGADNRKELVGKVKDQMEELKEVLEELGEFK